jgi:hypothetical protein
MVKALIIKTNLRLNLEYDYWEYPIVCVCLVVAHRPLARLVREAEDTENVSERMTLRGVRFEEQPCGP